MKHFKKIRRSIKAKKAKIALLNLLGRRDEKMKMEKALYKELQDLKSAREFLR